MNQVEFQVRPLTDQSGAEAVVPVVDGRTLVELVGDHERRLGYEPAGGYAGIVASHFNFGKLDRYLMGDPEAARRGSLLLGCECGEAGCWPLEAQITTGSGVVRWASFAQPFRTSWSYEGFGPFEFEAVDYLRALVTGLAGLHDDQGRSNTFALAVALDRVAGASALLDEHLEDHDELLAHVFIARIRDLALAAWDAEALAVADDITSVLDDALHRGDDEVVNAISVSFVEDLPGGTRNSSHSPTHGQPTCGPCSKTYVARADPAFWDTSPRCGSAPRAAPASAPHWRTCQRDNHSTPPRASGMVAVGLTAWRSGLGSQRTPSDGSLKVSPTVAPISPGSTLGPT